MSEVQDAAVLLGIEATEIDKVRKLSEILKNARENAIKEVIQGSGGGSHLVRLTQLNPDGMGPRPVILNTASIERIESTRWGYGRYGLFISMMGENEGQLYIAVDKQGNDTVREESAQTVISNFMEFVESLKH